MHQRGVLLGYAVHLCYRLADLIDTTALLIRSRGNFAHDVGHTGDGANNLCHGLPGLIHQRRACVNAVARVINQAFNLFRRLGAALGKGTYLAGNDGKAPALLTGTSRFYRCVQRQDVGLESNPVNHVGDLGNLMGAGGDLIHRPHHALYDATASLRGRGGIQRQTGSLTSVVGILLHGRRQLLHAGRRLFQRGRLLFGTGREIVAAGGDLARPGIDHVSSATHHANRVRQRRLHLLHVMRQQRHFVFAFGSNRPGQIACGDSADVTEHLIQRLEQHAAHRNPAGNNHGDHHQHDG